MAPDLVAVSGTERDALAAQAERVGLAALVRAMEVLGEAQVAMRDAPDPRVNLEVALVRLAHPEADDSPEALLARIERLEAAGRARTPVPYRHRRRRRRPARPPAPAARRPRPPAPRAPAPAAAAAPRRPRPPLRAARGDRAAAASGSGRRRPAPPMRGVGPTTRAQSGRHSAASRTAPARPTGR